MTDLKKWTLVAVGAALLLGFFALDINEYLTLSGLKASLADVERWQRQSPLALMLIFFIFYVLVTALSLPGAAIMTLAAGALFGLVYGTLLVSFASSLGATLAFLVSRYLLRDTVQRRFHKSMEQVNSGIQRDGAFYLFTLRLVPLFPFFLINLVMGVTQIKAWTFYWVSQLGMLLGTLVYVNAGTQLSQISDLRGIVSAPLLLSFVLLGLFPWIAKQVVSHLQRRRVYQSWPRPKRFDRNLVVMGAGAGGLVTAYIAAAVKAKVTLIENGKMGGDCLNYGCVPSKALIKSAKVAHQIRRAKAFGIDSAAPTIDFPQVMKGVQDKIAAIAPHDSVERYTQLGVDVVQGYGRIVDPWTVEVSRLDGTQQRLSARSIVIATGAAPVIPQLPGIDEVDYVTSDTLWTRFSELAEVPKRLVILGGRAYWL